MQEGHRLHRLRNQTVNVIEPDLISQEHGHRFLVGAVHGRAGGAALFRAGVGQRQTREVLHIRLRKGQRAAAEQIQGLHRAGNPLRVGQGQLNGQTHIRGAQLGHHRAVGELHHGVHHALPVDDHIHLLQRHPIQPHGFDDLQSLIHQGGAVDGDLRAHLPVGMLQGIGLGHGFQLLAALAEEGAAGAGQNQPFDLPFVTASHEALVNRGVLGVHGNDFRLVLFRFRHHQFPGADQGLLVGKTDALARPNGRQRGL